MDLILLGAVHRDPAGKKRLIKALEELQPAAISLEVSPASIRFRRKWGPRWIKAFQEGLAETSRSLGVKKSRLMRRSGPRGVYEYLRLPYEYRAALTYACENGRPLFLLDDSEISASFLNRVETEILTPENMTLLAQASEGASLAQEVRTEYDKAAANIFNNRLRLGPKVKDREAWIQREEDLAKKIRLLHQGLARRIGRSISGPDLVAGLIVAMDAVDFVPEKVTFPPEASHLYIGGWEHLVEDREGYGLYSRLKDLEPTRKLCFQPAGNA